MQVKFIYVRSRCQGTRVYLRLSLDESSLITWKQVGPCLWRACYWSCLDSVSLHCTVSGLASKALLTAYEPALSVITKARGDLGSVSDACCLDAFSLQALPCHTKLSQASPRHPCLLGSAAQWAVLQRHARARGVHGLRAEVSHETHSRR